MKRPGFSLIELAVVMLILGILAGVAYPRLTSGTDQVEIDATVSHLKTIMLAAEMRYNETGIWPDGLGQGQMPPDFVGYLRPNLFEVPCPCGGKYDWDEDVGGVKASLVVVDPNHDERQWLEIDRMLDDGDLTTGRVTRVSGYRLRVVVEY